MATANNHYNRSFGEVVGKGANSFNKEYQDAWGDDLYNGWNGEDSNLWDNGWMQGNGMNVTMTLERGVEKVKEREDSEKRAMETTKATGERDGLTGTRRGKPITRHNKHSAFQGDVDTDDEDDNHNTSDRDTDEYTNIGDTEALRSFKHNPNRRRRQKRRRAYIAIPKNLETDRCCCCEQSCNAAGDGDHLGCQWSSMTITTTTTTTGDDMQMTDAHATTQQRQPQPHPQPPPWRRHNPVMHAHTDNIEDDEAVRDAARADQTPESDWLGLEATDTSGIAM